jgi:hypothetical protein
MRPVGFHSSLLKSAPLPGLVYFGEIRPLRITARQASQALGAAKRSRTLQRLVHAALTGTLGPGVAQHKPVQADGEQDEVNRKLAP